MTILEDTMKSLLSAGRKIRIVQVGANDGRINDPIYRFAKRHRDQTKITLIEPNPLVIPHLSKNYRFHPDHEILERAVGPAGKLTLYTVDPSVWSSLEIDYAEDWPDYRAPTGVTSANIEHVRKWLERSGFISSGADSAISEISVESLPIAEMLNKDEMVDVLVIDAEGADEQIILENVKDGFLPSVIQFESLHLSAGRLSQLLNFLENLGYFLQHDEHNVLATFVDARSAKAGRGIIARIMNIFGRPHHRHPGSGR